MSERIKIYGKERAKPGARWRQTGKMKDASVKKSARGRAEKKQEKKCQNLLEINGIFGLFFWKRCGIMENGNVWL